MRIWAAAVLTASLATTADARELRYEAAAGTVRALEGDALVWENRHDRARRLGDTPAEGGLAGPIRLGDDLWYAIGGSAFRVDASSGVVRSRTLLPGYGTGIAPDGDGVRLAVVAADGSATWHRSWRLGPGHEVPFFLPGSLSQALLSRSDAQHVLRQRIEADSGAPEIPPGEAWRRAPAFRPYLEAALPDLEALDARDPTNPWYAFWRAQYLDDLGRVDEAESAFRSLLERDPAYDFELLPMALRLDAVSPALGDAAFERGLRFLVARGFEPESMLALPAVALHYGLPGREKDLDPRAELPRLLALGERLWDLAPLVEGAAYLYAGLAEASEAASRPEEAARWRERSRAALPSRAFGVPNPLASRAGPALNMVFAALLALALGVAVRGLRYARAQRAASGIARWNPFCAWTRGEIAGLLAVCALLVLSWSQAYRALTSIGRAASLPIAAVSGHLGHPAAVEYLSRLQGTPGGDLAYAVSLQRAGELERAAAIYERLDLPRARLNLGVIRAAQGDAAGARALYEEARNAAPGLPEAAHNLGETPGDPRIERLRRYGWEGPLAALPAPAQWSEALAGSARFGDLTRFFGSMSALEAADAGDAPGPTRADLVDAWHVLVTGVALTALLALVGLFVRAPAPGTGKQGPAGRLGRVLAFLVPGTARCWSALGPPLLVAFALAVLTARFLAASDGVSADLIEMVALPEVVGVHGTAAPVLSAEQRWMRELAGWWWALWLANLAFVALAERLRPDTTGASGS